jgi:hemolysin activation/secretion protein
MRIVLIISVFLILPAGFSFAQMPSAAQMSGAVTRQEEDINRTRNLEKHIEKPSAQIKEETPPLPKPFKNSNTPQTFIKDIQVEDAHILTPEEIEPITSKYKGRELSLEEMQQVADLITEAYRHKGFITSRAYIPVQSIKDGVLVIKALEARSGVMQIRGNKYFKSERLARNLDVKPGGYFDFSALQRSLVYINEHPDRKAKAVLVPGKEPGTTDIIVNIAERRPFHVGLEYDNYGSRYINRHRFSLVLEHNNLLGFDDLFYLKGQTSPDSRLVVEQLRYLFPVTPRWDLGLYAVNSELKLGKEFESLDAEGFAQIYGIFSSHQFVKTETQDFRLNLGFDYEMVRNKILGTEVSRDDLRIVKAGFDYDFEDPWGRDILAAEINSGLGDFWGGSDDKDPNATRSGAGGRFDKGVFTFFRLQPLPRDMALLWKNVAQYSNHNLPASQQFQVGGALSVRGYAPAEHFGDSGIYSAMELSTPICFIPRETLVPFTKRDLLYDDLRFVLFYDIATTHLNTPLVGEEENETLRGYGAGLRFNVQDYFTVRCEVGWPNGKKPSDGDSAHPWVEMTSKF